MASGLVTKIEPWPLARLIPYARNARTHCEDQVAGPLRRGFLLRGRHALQPAVCLRLPVHEGGCGVGLRERLTQVQAGRGGRSPPSDPPPRSVPKFQFHPPRPPARPDALRSVPKTCRAAGHRLNLPEAGAKLSGGRFFSVVCQFEFFEGGANHSRRHAKANIAASTPQVPQSYEGSNHEATKPAIMALASNPKTHTAIVLAIAYLCSGRFAILSSCPKDPKARSAPLSQSATS